MYPLFPILIRRQAHYLAEQAGEIELVFDAQLEGDLFDAEGGEEQVLAGPLHFEVIEIFDRGETGCRSSTACP